MAAYTGMTVRAIRQRLSDLSQKRLAELHDSRGRA
jgi:hypothetical protein